ncbi:MAG: SRPBCC family protein [Myxococcales bacterium]|nr:SRPBCC family protein [Myxococcales bacterium]
MSTVHIERPMSHGADRVWEALSDIGGIYRFHPLVARSPLTSSHATGLGASRTCHFHDGNHIDERVVGWQEGERVDIEIVRGSMPLKQAHASLAVRPSAEGSVVSMTMDYTPKFGIVGSVLDALMMRRQFRKVVSQILEGLDEHLRSGDVVGPAAA